MSELDTGALGPGRIEPRELEQEMRSSYLDYAMSVIVGRALPDVRDGLKPVHRRVLYAMWTDGNRYNRKHVKSAAVVGQVNFGSVDDDPPAAMRYCVTGDTRVATPAGTIRIDQLTRVEPNSEADV